MPRIYAFFNPLAGNGNCKNDVRFLDLLYDEEILYWDMTKPETYEQALFALRQEDSLILCGGDGTLNRFFNLVSADTIPCDILYFPLGNTNGFAQRLGWHFGCQPFSIRRLLGCLPIVTDGQRQAGFLSEIGLCSRRGVCATITIDGTDHSFKHLRQITIRPNYKTHLLELCCFDAYRQFQLRLKIKKPLSCSGRTISLALPKATTVQLDGDPIDNVSGFTATIETR